MNKQLATGAVTIAAVGAGALLVVAPGPATGTSAVPPASQPSAASAPLEAPGLVASAASVPGAQAVGMTIPTVVLAHEVAVEHGRLRTPVLLTDPSVQAVARVAGGPPSCSQGLVAATVVWIDCAVVGTTLRLEVVDASGGVVASRRIG